MSGSPTPLASVAGSVYLPVIADQIGRERDRKTSLEGRALQVVGVSTLSSTLLSGFVSNVLPKPGAASGSPVPAVVSGSAAVVFEFALVALLVAAAIGLIANWYGNSAGSFAELPLDDLEKWAGAGAWSQTDTVAAAQQVATVQVKKLFHARRINTRKKKLFALAVTFEIVALVLVVVTFIVATK